MPNQVQPDLKGLALLQLSHREDKALGLVESESEEGDAPAPAPTEEKEAEKTAPAGEEKAAAPGNATGANATSAETPSSNTTAETETSGVNATATNATANTTNKTTGCATKKDPRVKAWFATTSPDGTPCVFGVADDPRDEQEHCIFDNGMYGSNGWCYTSKDRTSWGSCNEKCPLYGLSKALGTKIDKVAKSIADVAKVLNGTSSEAATAAVSDTPGDKKSEAKGDKKSEDTGDKKSKGPGDEKADKK